MTSAYPSVDLRPDGDRTRLRWFLRAKPGGVVEDLLTGTESHGLFMEMMYVASWRSELKLVLIPRRVPRLASVPRLR